MRVRYAAAGGLALLIPALFATSCGGFQGELMVAVQTDMSLPKDIDAIAITVSVLGTVKYDFLYDHLGTEGATPKLPATLALLGPENVGDPVKIHVTGLKNGKIRVTRDAVTTVPEGRVVTLPMKLEGLCADVDTHDDKGNILTSLCAEDETCVGGSCSSNEVSSTSLKDFDPTDVFGGGTGNGDGACFDVSRCFIGADALTPISQAPCTYAAPAVMGAFNVGLLTEITGICGAASCLVALDAGSADGWTIDAENHIVLPNGACDPKLPNAALGVVFAPVTADCPQKTLSLPTCGAWSSSGSSPPPPDKPTPTAIATKQPHPNALALTDTDVYWANTGVTSGAPKSWPSIKRSSTEANNVGVVTGTEKDMASPRGITVMGGDLLFTNLEPNTLVGAIRGIPRGYFVDKMGAVSTLGAADSPEGIAASTVDMANMVFWTEFGGGNVKGATLDKNGTLTEGFDLGVGLKHPLRIVANSTIACWTEEGSLGGASGLITCKKYDPAAAAPTSWSIGGQSTPRALALDDAGVVYWATFEADGKIMRAEPFVTLDPPPPSSTIVTGQSYPNGIAVDATRIYWTNWGDGTVRSMALTGSSDVSLVADTQDRPSAIATNKTELYWINEGSSTEATGSVMHIKK